MREGGLKYACCLFSWIIIKKMERDPGRKMKRHDRVLDLFHPLIRKWFSENLGTPTDIQARSWPVIARGSHLLITAPTGSGKTLAAFLWAINQLVSGAWSTGQTRVLYVSPLKALNNDIRRNLTAPLDQLDGYFKDAGEPFPEVHVLTRSGDTPAEERRQMLRRRPEILITTPESLNIMLSSRSGRTLLTGLATVILDEIHAVVGSKRGTHLMTAVDRLVLLTGEFQRLALSATVKPLETVAEFVGGFMQTGGKRSGQYERRRVEIIRSRDTKQYAVEVRFPPDARERLEDASWWPVLVESFREIVRTHRSTLLFVNSRRTAEKVTRLINESEPQELAYAHHGSLSREIRLAVEQRLKNGELKAIVATSSLELGIDIGDLDRVVLIQTPPSISSAIQRIGRSGHRVGEVSRGLLYPTHGRDFLNAAVVARCVTDQDIESVRPVEAPLDVLAQMIVSMTGQEQWDVDGLFAFIRTSWPYRSLSRRQFDLVISMLAGRYADTRLRELRPRISLDRLDNTVRSREGAQRLIYLSGGTIPDRGYYDLRIEESRARIGELDEEFVWERHIGDTFALGAQVWRIRKITANDVEVVPAETVPGIFPFWRAEDLNRDFHFSEKILAFLGHFNGRLEDPSVRDELSRDYFLDPWAADELAGFLQRQRDATDTDLPHRTHLVVEHFDDPLNTSDRKQVILHTLWGGRVNRPFGLALQAAWEEKYRYRLEIIENNDCLLVMLPHGFSAHDLFDLVTPENLERLLRVSLEQSGFFGAKFRENAGRALLLSRSDFKKRLPLWLNRLRSKKLMDAVMQYRDFPILLETWRTCLQDEFDLQTLSGLLEEIRSGHIRLSEAVTRTASPFAEGLVWKQTNTYMYQDDSPPGARTSGLSRDLLKEIVFASSLRPRIPRSLIESLEAKLQRTAPGYSPRSADELLDWLKERFIIPEPEWQALLAAMERDHELTALETVEPVRSKVITVLLPGASIRLVSALENLKLMMQAFSATPEDLDVQNIAGAPATVRSMGNGTGEQETADIFLQWLSFYGPLGRDFIRDALGLDGPALDALLAGPAEDGELVVDLLSESATEQEICDRENLEILLRMARRLRRPSFRALGIEKLPLYLASWQGLVRQGDSLEDLQNRMDQLFGFPAPAQAWEEQILPARISPYFLSWLDTLMQTSGLAWIGCGNRKITFSFAEDLELFLGRDSTAGGKKNREDLLRFFPGTAGRYHLLDLARHSGSDSRSASRKLWSLAWKGLVTNDSFASLRQEILANFQPEDMKGGHRRPFRTGPGRWTAARPFPGNWYILEPEGPGGDPIDEAELVKDRARQLLRRYGILFRELPAYELPSLQWASVFRALRIMELSGEILSGHFFEGIPGIQFISHEAFRFLNEPMDEDSSYWLNAADPASLCGVRLVSLKSLLPSRLPSTHLVFRGSRPVIVSRRNGKELNISVTPDDPGMQGHFSFFKVMLGREFNPDKVISIETVNGKPVLESGYLGPLKEFGFRAGYKGLELEKRY